MLIADADKKFCEEMKIELEERGPYKVCGIANDGEQAIQLVSELRPDILIMDLLLPLYNGLTVLDMISDVQPKPSVFVTTAFVSKYIATYLDARKVSCLFLKPCSVKIIANHMEELRWQVIAPIQQPLQDVKHQITELLNDIGVPANIKGYQYLREAIRIAVEAINRTGNMTEYIYKPVALLHNTTPECVRRAILRAIEIAWDRGNLETLRSLFGYIGNDRKGKTTNSEFIALLADKLSLWINANGVTL